MTTYIDKVRELLDAIGELLELEVAGYQRASSIRYQLSIVRSMVSAHEAEVRELVEAAKLVDTHYSGSLDHQPPYVRAIRAALLKFQYVEAKND
jgi:hypothetical protein